jgi:hypothetical protein
MHAQELRVGTLAAVPTVIHCRAPFNERLAYKGLCAGAAGPACVRMSKRVMSLPVGPDLTVVDQEGCEYSRVGTTNLGCRSDRGILCITRLYLTHRGPSTADFATSSITESVTADIKSAETSMS